MALQLDAAKGTIQWITQFSLAVDLPGRMQLRFYPRFSWCAREDVNGLLIRYTKSHVGYRSRPHDACKMQTCQDTCHYGMSDKHAIAFATCVKRTKHRFKFHYTHPRLTDDDAHYLDRWWTTHLAWAMQSDLHRGKSKEGKIIFP